MDILLKTSHYRYSLVELGSTKISANNTKQQPQNMKHKIKTKIKQITQHPRTQKVLVSLKPEKSVWGFLGIVLFLIVPEIIAFIWGIEITAFAKAQILFASSFLETQYYSVLLMLFKEGGSWFNLSIAAALLIWFFF